MCLLGKSAMAGFHHNGFFSKPLLKPGIVNAGSNCDEKIEGDGERDVRQNIN